MGGFAKSILNPINDISNILVGTKNLVVNPGKQISQYIEPAVIEAAPAALAIGTILATGGAAAPAAAALFGAAGTYGAQIAQQGIGGFTSGKTYDIGDLGVGATLAAGGYGLATLGGASTALGAPSLSLSTLGSGIVSGGEALGAGAATAAGAVGGALGDAGGVAGGVLHTAATVLGTAAAGLGAYGAYENLKASQQSSGQCGTQAQVSQAYSQIMGLSPSQLVAITAWNELLPCFSSQQQASIGALFTVQMVEALMAEAKDGSITQQDFDAIMSVIPQSVQQQAQTAFAEATGTSAPEANPVTLASNTTSSPYGTTSSPYGAVSGSNVMPASYTQAVPANTSSATQSSINTQSIADYALIGGGVILAGWGIYKILT